jgi:hypothetical protein
MVINEYLVICIMLAERKGGERNLITEMVCPTAIHKILEDSIFPGGESK